MLYYFEALSIQRVERVVKSMETRITTDDPLSLYVCLQSCYMANNSPEKLRTHFGWFLVRAGFLVLVGFNYFFWFKSVY